MCNKIHPFTNNSYVLLRNPKVPKLLLREEFNCVPLGRYKKIPPDIVI